MNRLVKKVLPLCFKVIPILLVTYLLWICVGIPLLQKLHFVSKLNTCNVCYVCGRPATHNVWYEGGNVGFCSTCTPPPVISTKQLGRGGIVFVVNIFKIIWFIIGAAIVLSLGTFLAALPFIFGVAAKPSPVKQEKKCQRIAEISPDDAKPAKPTQPTIMSEDDLKMAFGLRPKNNQNEYIEKGSKGRFMDTGTAVPKSKSLKEEPINKDPTITQGSDKGKLVSALLKLLFIANCIIFLSLGFGGMQGFSFDEMMSNLLFSLR